MQGSDVASEVGSKRNSNKCPFSKGASPATKKTRSDVTAAPGVCPMDMDMADAAKTKPRVVEAYKAIFRQMQPGLIYPADYAGFLMCWTDKQLKREELVKVLDKVNCFIEKNYGVENKEQTSSVVVGLSFETITRWCKEEGMEVPKAVSLKYNGVEGKNVFSRNGTVFKNSKADYFFHIKSDQKGRVNEMKKVIQNAFGDNLWKEEYQECGRRNRISDPEGPGRVLGCRFAENLNNPADPVTIASHTLVGFEDSTHLGGSVVLAQKFDINWQNLHMLSNNQFEDLVGRTVNDEIIPSRDPRCHIRASRPRDAEGNSSYVLRLGLPYGHDEDCSGFSKADELRGHNKGDEKGIFFAGYMKSGKSLERVMADRKSVV